MSETDFTNHHRDCEWLDSGTWNCHAECLQNRVWRLETLLRTVCDRGQVFSDFVHERAPSHLASLARTRQGGDLAEAIYNARALLAHVSEVSRS